jgi:hypothetical protein
MDRLNAWALKLIRRRQRGGGIVGVTCDEKGFSLYSKSGAERSRAAFVPWPEVEHIVAVTQPSLVGSDLMLLVQFRGTAATLTATLDGWHEFMQACETYLQGSMPQGEWQTRLMAQDSNSPLEIFCRR